MRKIVYFIIIFITIYSISGFSSFGQGIRLKAGIDSTHFLLGDQIKLGFQVTQPKNVQVIFPEFNDTIIDKIEIIEKFDPDTTWLTNEEIQISHEYIVTSFDSGFYYFPPFDFPIKSEFIDDTMQSNPFYAQVFHMDIDTSKGIVDIKTPYDMPFKLIEVLPIIYYGLSSVFLVLAIIYIIIRKRNNKPVFKRIKPKLPPHIVAFDELDKLKAAKLWQQGKIKQYYTELTEIIRVYIEDRYFLRALEQTTEETIESFKTIGFSDEEALKELQELLVLADFVKFAKANPLPDENEKSFQFAYNFIRRTRPVEESQPEKSAENEEEVANLEQNTKELKQ